MVYLLDEEFHTRRRTEAEARAEMHSPRFCRQVLDGAFEPIYDADGKKIGRRDMSGNCFDLHGNPIPAPFKAAAE